MLIDLFFSIAQAHSSVERAGLLGGVQLRLIKADSENRLRGDALETAIKEDIAAGNIPFYVSFMQEKGYSHAKREFHVIGRCYPRHNKFLCFRLFG